MLKLSFGSSGGEESVSSMEWIGRSEVGLACELSLKASAGGVSNFFWTSSISCLFFSGDGGIDDKIVSSHLDFNSRMGRTGADGMSQDSSTFVPL